MKIVHIFETYKNILNFYKNYKLMKICTNQHA